MRSWLFVPGDSARKLDKAASSGADALILDLEDSVAPGAKETARETALAYLQERAGAGPALYVRVNALDTGLTDEDLAAVMPGKPAGIVLPKSASGADVTHLDAKITAQEALAGIDEGATKIAAIVTETAASLFGAGTYAEASPRLAAMSWGAEDLSAALGASSSRDDDGALTDPFRLARALCIAGAVAAGAQPVDTVYVAFKDEAGLKDECAAAARDGFTGKQAIHPAQVPVINEAFTPPREAIEHARRLVAAFAEAHGAGVLSIDGEMVDIPHLKRAQRLLERARLAGIA